jgi:hypothetical protein
MFNLANILKILGILYNLLAAGHNLGLYDKNGAPINNVTDLKGHLESIKSA